MLDSLVRIARKTTFSHTYLEPASPRFRVILVNRIRKINHWTDWDLLPAVGNSKKKEEQKKKKTQQQHVDYRLEILGRKDFWDCYSGQGETDWLIAVQHDPRRNCGTHFGSSSFLAYKVTK